jgi:hypothetical protein
MATEPPAERCEDEDEEPMHGRRHARRPELVPEGGEEREAFGKARHAVVVGAAVSGEREGGLEEACRLQCGTELHAQVGLAVSGVPPRMRDARSDDAAAARDDGLGHSVDLSLHGAGDDLEALLLVRVQVLLGNHGSRAEEAVELEQLADRGSQPPEAQTHPHRGVFDDVPYAGHVAASPSTCATRSSTVMDADSRSARNFAVSASCSALRSKARKLSSSIQSLVMVNVLGSRSLLVSD